MEVTKTLKEAQQQGFIVVTGSFTIAKQFFAWCEKSGHPFVRITPRKKFATVHMDLIANDYQLSWEGCCLLARSVPHEFGRGRWEGAAKIASTYGYVPIDSAVDVAKTMIAIASDPLNRD